jgi:hypothetical protein
MRSFEAAARAWVALPLALLVAAPAAAAARHGAPRMAAAPASRAALQDDWTAIEGRPISPERVQAVLQRLAQASALDARAQRVAWRVGLDEAQALRLEPARAIQQRLHELVRADWSAMDLALTLNRLEGAAASDPVLEEQIARSHAPAELWAQRGIYWLGAQNEARARDCLGHALAYGSSDAALVLAREDLARGRTRAARAGFRALLLDERPSPWALRGFGISLLEGTP